MVFNKGAWEPKNHEWAGESTLLSALSSSSVVLWWWWWWWGGNKEENNITDNIRCETKICYPWKYFYFSVGRQQQPSQPLLNQDEQPHLKFVNFARYCSYFYEQRQFCDFSTWKLCKNACPRHKVLFGSIKYKFKSFLTWRLVTMSLLFFLIHWIWIVGATSYS